MNRITLVICILLCPAFALAGSGEVKYIALDVSGSMKKAEPALKAALIQYILDRDRGDKVVIIPFSTFAEDPIEIAVESEGDRTELGSALQNLKFEGEYTNFDEVIKAWKAHLWDSKVQAESVLEIWTDGKSDPSPGKEPLDLSQISDQSIQHKGFKIFTLTSKGTEEQDRSPDVKRQEITEIIKFIQEKLMDYEKHLVEAMEYEPEVSETEEGEVEDEKEEIYAISEVVGESIDRDERDQFGLFAEFEGFVSASYYKKNGSYYLEIVTEDEGGNRASKRKKVAKAGIDYVKSKIEKE